MDNNDSVDHMCFGCSPKNPIGLKLQFFQRGDIVYTTFQAGVEHQGYNGCMHGGLISTLLDETMAQWLWIRDIQCMTAEMTVRYSEGVPIHRELRVESRCVKQRRDRLFEMEGRVILPGGNVAVRSTAKFLKIDLSEI